MLAEPKRKIKWSPNPCGNLWSKDSSKFGQKILEKFGWTPGKGLGANEQGITGPVRLKCNSTQKGLGFERGNKLECFQHQREFDMILSELSSSSDGPSVKETCASLEEASKNCRTRVHYHKFTRGKDLSRYSEKDLSCILGAVSAIQNKVYSEKTPDDVSFSTSNDGENQASKEVGNIKSEIKKKKRKRKYNKEDNISEPVDSEVRETERCGIESEQNESEVQITNKFKSKKKRKYLNNDSSHELSISEEKSIETPIICEDTSTLSKVSKSKKKKSKKRQQT